MAIDAVEHADQVGAHRDRLAIAPGDDPFVLERELEPVAAVAVTAFDGGRAAQKSFRRPTLDVDDLAGEQLLAAFAGEHGGDRILVPAVRRLHHASDADGRGGGEVDAPVLDLAAGARRLAGGGDRAHLDADLAAGTFHPFPARDLGHDGLDAARVIERAGIGAQAADRHRGHLRLGEGAAHAVRIDHRNAEMDGRHQRLHAVAAADLHRHHGCESDVVEFFLHAHGSGDAAAVGQALLSDQRRAHVGDDSDPVVVIEIERRHQLDPMAVGIEPAQIEQAEIGTAAAAGAQDPGADRQCLDVVEADVLQLTVAHDTSSSTTRAAAAMARITGPP